MSLDEQELQQFFSDAFGRRILIRISNETLDPSQLCDNERIRMIEMRHPEKLKTWLKGRAALKLLLGDLQMIERSNLPDTGLVSIDTTQFSVPNRRFSLSHSGDFAIAVACLDDAEGVGVDLEKWRIVRVGSSKFYLSTSEQDLLKSTPNAELNESMLRLWTVKEALFKSDLNNAGKTVSKYLIENPLARTGKAFTREGELTKTYRYCSTRCGDYLLTIALADAEL